MEHEVQKVHQTPQAHLHVAAPHGSTPRAPITPPWSSSTPCPEYNGHKEVWEGFAEDFPFDSPAFARKYATWESCVADLERMPFIREMYGLQVQFVAYMDYKTAKKAFKWCDAALKDTILPEIQRAAKWDREFEDRRIEHESKASRVIFIVDEDPRMFSEYKAKIIQTFTPIMERPDSPTRQDHLATSNDKIPGSLMSSWHLEGDSLDPVLIYKISSKRVKMVSDSPIMLTPVTYVQRKCMLTDMDKMTIGKVVSRVQELHLQHQIDTMWSSLKFPGV
jgi:hypothetical protein